MNSRDRARQWLQDNGIEESLTTEDSLTFEFEEHAAEAVEGYKLEHGVLRKSTQAVFHDVEELYKEKEDGQ